jgi:hypothetical protein
MRSHPVLNEEASSVSSLSAKVSGLGVALLFLSGCASGAGAADPGATGGTLELVVSETCAAGSAPECVDVNGEYVRVPSAGFSRAGVESVAVATDQAGNAVDVTLTSEVQESSSPPRPKPHRLGATLAW